MNDIEVVNNATAEATLEEQARQEAALAEWREQEATRKKAANHRADVKLGLRTLAFAGFVVGLIVAARMGWLHPVLGGAVLCLSCTWFGFHLGAWHQFRARKEEKLYG